MDANEMNQKYQQLATEFSKLRAQCSVLKKAVLEEQKKNEHLQFELGQKDELLKKSLLENESLNKRIQHLEKCIEELQKEMSNKSHGKHPEIATEDSKSNVSIESNEVARLRDEVALRISETGSLRAKLLDTETDFNQQLAETGSKLQAISMLSESNESALRSLRASSDKENERLNQAIAAQATKLREKDRIIESLSRKYQQSKIRLDVFESKQTTVIYKGSAPTGHSSSSRPDANSDRQSNRKRFELKSSISEAQFTTALRLHISKLTNAFASWLPSTAMGDMAELFEGQSLFSIIDGSANYSLFRLVPALRSLRSLLKSESSSTASRSTTKHAPLITVKLDGMQRCIDSFIAICVRFSSELLTGLSNRAAGESTELQTRPVAISALVQAVGDAHTLTRRYVKLHTQRLSLLNAALRSKTESQAADVQVTEQRESCGRLEAEQLAILSCENALETLFAFLKATTALIDEANEDRDLIRFDDDASPEPQVPERAANDGYVVECQAADLQVDLLQEHVRLLENQLRNCVKRLQIAESHKRATIIEQVLANGSGQQQSQSQNDVRTFYERLLQRLGVHVQAAQSRIIHFAAESSALRTQLLVMLKKLEEKTQESTLIRTNYQQQLAAMSEHLAELNTLVTSQYDELEALRRRAPDPSAPSSRR